MIIFKQYQLLPGLVAAFSLLGTPALAINKCTGADGSVVFQDAACATGDSLVGPKKVAPAPTFQSKTPRPPMGDEEYERKRAIERSREIDRFAKTRGAEIKDAIDADSAKCGSGVRSPHIGATAAWIRNCSVWGEPNQTNKTMTVLGESQQWVYRHHGYLYFNNSGVVTAIQER